MLELLVKKFCGQKVQLIYNQVFQQLLLSNSEFSKNKDGINVILIRLSDLFEQQRNEKSPNSINQSLDELIQALGTMQSNMRVPLLILVTPVQDQQAEDFYLTIERKLALAIQPMKEIILITSGELLNIDSTINIFNKFTDKYAHIPYTLEFYAGLSILIARKYHLLTRKPYKVIVLDCDNTLWDGVLEEDGIDGIAVSKTAKELQQFMIDRNQAGFLLCLCSKNSDQSILMAFKQHKDMLLSLDKHICSYRINWQSKSSNIKSLANELNVGLDSFIFVDDNRIECAEVKAAIPDVLTIELPTEKERRIEYLKNIWAFDPAEVGLVDNNRTLLYKQNALREKLKTQSVSYAQFLENLNIKIIIRQAWVNDYQRIIQLNQRTNQFNFYPQAISDIDLGKRIQKEERSCLVVEVKDKFGDYGLVGVVAYDFMNDELQVKAFLLSCRILGRGVEYEVVQKISEMAEENSIKKIRVFFKITERNSPGIAFIQKISHVSSLKKLNDVLLSTEQAKSIAFVPEEEEGNKHTDAVTQRNVANVSNDIILEIAEKYSTPKSIMTLLNKKNKTSKDNIISRSFKASILEILKSHNLRITKLQSSFLEMGVDSLKSVLIANDIYQIYGIEVNPFDLLSSNLTIEKFIEKLSSKIESGQSNQIKIEINSVLCQAEHELSHSQKRIWYEEKISPGSSKNNIFVAYEIQGGINESVMTLSFMKLLERHDSLRFSFFEKSGEPYIIVKPLSEVYFKINKIIAKDEEELNQFLNDFKYNCFDLSNSPLLRVALIKGNNNTSTLLICIHHIIHDGWSLNILLEELSVIYRACLNNTTIPLPRLPMSYLEFTAWQKECITNDLLAKQSKFWENYLSKINKLEIVYDKINHENKVPCKRINFKINKKVTHELKRIAASCYVTLYDILVTAFSIFLSHYTNKYDVHFITAVSGRQSPKVKNIIGFFVGLILLRIKVHESESFLDLLRRNKQMMEEVFLNQDLPLNEIMKFTGESVNTKFNSFIQAGFIFQNYPINPLVVNDHECKRIYSDDQAALIYDACTECRFGNLVCFMQEFNSELHGTFEFNEALFNDDTILHIISSFKTLIENVVNQHDGIALNIPLLNTKTRKKILYQWNQPSLKYSDTDNLLKYFNEQVVMNPDAIAIKYKKKHLTYLELDKKSNQLARRLQSEGVKYETAVGICLPQSINRIVAILSIIKAGGCYVPLEADLPVARINYMITDANIPLLITEEDIADVLWEDDKPIKTLFLSDNSTQSESDLPLENNTSLCNLAYILYTSGSTGQPKGVMIEQKGILRLVKSTNYVKINSCDRVSQTSSFQFDVATFEIWGALLNGATLILIDKATLLDTIDFAQYLEKENISILFLTTQIFHIYAFTAPHLFCGLKYMVIAGDVLLTEAVEKVINQSNCPQYLINAYGPTENTTFSTAYSIHEPESLENPIPIGKPILGTQVYVLDKNFNLKPIGAPGKLYLGGIGLSRNYIHNDKLNLEKFINTSDTNILLNQDERLYDTGDIVVWQANGNLRFIGREDNQVKINGYRVELGEIEAQLDNHPLVEQVAVLIKNQEHSQQIVAFVQLQKNHSLREVNLHHYIRINLPHYMLPNFYCQIQQFPLTENGKIDRKMLVEMNLEHVTYREYESPHNLFQEKLISIYAKILNIDSKKISINTDFFDMGGNSILALHLIMMIHEQLHVKIDFSLLYEHSNIKQLSKQINYLLNENDHSDIKNTYISNHSLKIVKEGNKDKIPLVFIHPVGGTGFCYLDLIKILPEEQPCFIIQDPSIEANQILFDDIAIMAAYYNDLLLKQFRNKKFILAGFSFGGMLCLEMAAQLDRKQSGDLIEAIISFDTWVVSDFLNIEAKEALKASIMQQYEKIMKNLISENIDPKPWMELYYYRLQDLGFSYRPSKINNKVILFKAQQQLGEFSALQDSANFLNLHTKQQVEVHLIPGSHDTILQFPHVYRIVDILNSYFNVEKMSIA